MGRVIGFRDEQLANNILESYYGVTIEPSMVKATKMVEMFSNE